MNDRYQRQILIENWDQTKLQQSTVTIVGLGALGTIVATSLAMAGVGNLILVDFDTIEISNLNRQLFFRTKDVGKPKVRIAAKVLNEINPEINIKEFNLSIEKVPQEELSKSTVIVEGLDTFQIRRWVNSFIVSKKIPLVSGGIYGFLGNIQVVIPDVTPCLECQSLIPEEELQKACTPFGEVRKQIRSEVNAKDIIPSVSSVSFVIGGLMAQEALKILLGISSLESFLFWDGKIGLFTSVPLKKRENCFVCSPHFQLDVIPIHIQRNRNFKEFKHQIQYSFNLGPDMGIIYKTSELKATNEQINSIFESGDIFRVIDPALSEPLKFKIIIE